VLDQGLGDLGAMGIKRGRRSMGKDSWRIRKKKLRPEIRSEKKKKRDRLKNQ